MVDDRYRLLEVIASGGMGTVWRALDTRLNRQVAIKRPHAATEGAAESDRVLREARAAASLDHPHLVTVHDVGQDDEGVYLVMELVDGPALHTVGSTLDRRAVIGVGAQIADALAAIHRKGIVHGDVKPANILLPDDRARLADFGVAIDTAAVGHDEPTDVVFATPDYAASEVLEGRPPMPESDVFSLAAVIYELLAGRKPFDGPDRDVDPPPLGDAALDPILADALAPDPDRRPDAAELARGLRGGATTRTVGGAGGSTIPLGGPVATADSDTADTEMPSDRGQRRWWVAAAALLTGIVALSLLAFDGENAPSRGDGSAAMTETTAVSETTTASETTEVSETAPPTTSGVSEDVSDVGGDDVADARAELEEALSRAHPSEFNPGEVRKAMDRTVEASELMADGEEGEAARLLDELSTKIDEKLGGDIEEDALAALDRLRAALGL